ncbi:MAG: hypothetical protein AB7F19_06940 [Candidatus Babeliales bacterium]
MKLCKLLLATTLLLPITSLFAMDQASDSNKWKTTKSKRSPRKPSSKPVVAAAHDESTPAIDDDTTALSKLDGKTPEVRKLISIVLKVERQNSRIINEQMATQKLLARVLKANEAQQAQLQTQQKLLETLGTNIAALLALHQHTDNSLSEVTSESLTSNEQTMPVLDSSKIQIWLGNLPDTMLDEPLESPNQTEK